MCILLTTGYLADDVHAVVEAAFNNGARGLEFQYFAPEVAPDGPRLDHVYELCAEYDRPVLHHTGNAPMFENSPYLGIERV